MARGALIGAYQEDAGGALRALLPLAGRTLVEYQARCAAAVGASPIIILVERIPAALQQALDRLRLDGIAVTAVSDGNEAAARFEASSPILLIGDGVAPSVDLLINVTQDDEPLVVTIPDEEQYQAFERVDGGSRWAGVALIDGQTLGATAAMLGDWDLQSTLLRKGLQDGARRMMAASGEAPLLANSAGDLAGFERRLIVASRGGRRDWASRYAFPIVEEFATEQLMETGVRPQWLLWAALGLTLASAFAFTRGWLLPGLLIAILSAPLDLIARRLALLRLRPLPPSALARRLLWPAGGLALVALGWRLATDGSGWGALVTTFAAVAFAQATRIERGAAEMPGEPWLFSRRNAILMMLPFALAGGWTAGVVAVAIYAALSFFFVQHVRHGFEAIDGALTRI